MRHITRFDGDPDGSMRVRLFNAGASERTLRLGREELQRLTCILHRLGDMSCEEAAWVLERGNRHGGPKVAFVDDFGHAKFSFYECDMAARKAVSKGIADV